MSAFLQASVWSIGLLLTLMLLYKSLIIGFYEEKYIGYKIVVIREGSLWSGGIVATPKPGAYFLGYYLIKWDKPTLKEVVRCAKSWIKEESLQNFIQAELESRKLINRIRFWKT